MKIKQRSTRYLININYVKTNTKYNDIEYIINTNNSKKTKNLI